jgi:pyruvate dehydrogenase E1 component
MGNKDTKITELEKKEWLDSVEGLYQTEGSDGAKSILEQLEIRARIYGIEIKNRGTTPYINTIPSDKQPPYPGRREIERRIKSIIRWNAMAMVVRANREESGIGGHISTYASAATLFEVGFNHFFKAKNDQQEGDIV